MYYKYIISHMKGVVKYMAFDELDREEWHITDDSGAEWALQRIAEEQAEFKRLKNLGEKQIEDIKNKVEAAQKRYENSTAYFNAKLLEYFQSVPHKKTKSGIEKYVLLSGTLTLKPPALKPTVDDEKLVEWLAANGYTDYIKTKQTAAWGDFKKSLDLSSGVPIVKDTGEVVEGITFESVPETFDIKFDKKESEE